jgi:CheY-like chemotaxis protein
VANTILVVDDNSDIRESVAEFLRLLGWSVATAGDGRRGLELLRELGDRVRLVLLDLHMPIMDGVSFRKRQLADPGLSEIPILIVSGEEDLCTTAAELGVEGFLEKPFSLDNLRGAVERIDTMPGLVDKGYK